MDKCFVDLLEYLPLYWHSYLEMIEIQRSIGVEVGRQKCELNDILKEVFIESSSKYLYLFERELGISFDENLSDELRRELIIAKLRGVGTTTKELVKKVAESFSGGEVMVFEQNDKYIIHIKFIGTRGIPQNLNGLKKSLREIIPAHLGITYEFTYLTWAEFDSYNKTWKEWGNLNLTWKDFEKYKEAI